MIITWFGESGFRVESGGRALLIDPYFSDALGRTRPDMRRVAPADPAWTQEAADYLLFTHAHIDHTDPETVRALLRAHPALVMAGPPSSRAALPFAPVYIDLTRGACAQLAPFSVRALPAVHSDPGALGYDIRVEGKTLYFSGDTALLCALESSAPHGADAAFLCFNEGPGKNMSPADAARLARLCGFSRVVPTHYGVLPGGASPDELARLLAAQGTPMTRPAVGERFSL